LYDINSEINNRKAEAEWQTKMVAQWLRDSEDQDKPEEMRN